MSFELDFPDGRPSIHYKTSSTQLNITEPKIASAPSTIHNNSSIYILLYYIFMLSRFPLADVTSTKKIPAPFGSLISWLFLAGRWSRHGLGNGGRPEILRNVCSLWGKWGEKPSSSAGFCSAHQCPMPDQFRSYRFRKVLLWCCAPHRFTPGFHLASWGWFGTTPWWFGWVFWLPITKRLVATAMVRFIQHYVYIYIYVCVRERVWSYIHIYTHIMRTRFSQFNAIKNYIKTMH